MGKELLVEIGTEEIPARFTPKALGDMADLIRREFRNLEVSFGEIQTVGTPRRLVARVDDVAGYQKDTLEKKLGPPSHLAFDDKGHPTKAAEGFAKAQGIGVEDLETVATEKGEYLCAVRRQKGRKTADLLRESLPRLITAIPFLKSMRWGSSGLRFVRPIHWILALFDGQLIPFHLETLQSGDVTYGHRFMSPGAVKVRGFAEYVKKLREASVFVDPAERRAMIEKEIHAAAAGVSGRIRLNQELLEEVNYLVEFPRVVLGEFDRGFLILPAEVIVHAMEDHQRYFPVVDSDGNLLPHFVCVCNTQAVDMEVVKRGNERVLRARLSDATFFFNEDKRVPLERRVDGLKEVVFQAKLGTSYDKVIRLQSLSRFIALKLRPEVESAVDRAAFLCKADLMTGMVGEFPTLQGTIGREYALLSGEPEEVADAIRDHYFPAFAGDRLPSSAVGDFVSVADKLDTITGCFGIGLIPTGAGDPLALRRQALGILNILLEKQYPLSLREIVGESVALLRERLERPQEEIHTSVIEFFKQRFHHILISKGVLQDTVEAVVGVGFDDVTDCQERIAALTALRQREGFSPLATAFKRVVNISRDSHSREVDPALFREDAEKELNTGFLGVEKRVDRLFRTRRYQDVLVELGQLKEPVDRFFDRVLVMDPDKDVRNNRLALLGRIADLFSKIADFSKISTG
jgi:glycyl-tRNA synthetase beta chain